MQCCYNASHNTSNQSREGKYGVRHWFMTKQLELTINILGNASFDNVLYVYTNPCTVYAHS